MTKSTIPFTSIGTDPAQTIKLKGEEGLQGITYKPSTLLKYCLAAPHLGRLAKETEEIFCTAQDVHPSKHQHLSSIHTARQENNVQALKAVLKPYNLFCDDGKQLFNFITKQVARKETELSILNMERRGNDEKDSVVNERICGGVNLSDPMKKVRPLN